MKKVLVVLLSVVALSSVTVFAGASHKKTISPSSITWFSMEKSTDLPAPNYEAFRQRLMSRPKAFKRIRANHLQIADLWATSEKPTGLPSLSYVEYKRLVQSQPKALALLRRNGMQVSDLWKINDCISWTKLKTTDLLRYFPHLIWISRSRQRLVYFEYGIPKRIIPVSTGKNGDRFGWYLIDYKQRLHISHGIKECEGVAMPFALHFDCGRFIHASTHTYCIGKFPDSGGCPREFRRDANDMFGLVETAVHVVFTA